MSLSKQKTTKAKSGPSKKSEAKKIEMIKHLPAKIDHRMVLAKLHPKTMALAAQTKLLEAARKNALAITSTATSGGWNLLSGSAPDTKSDIKTMACDLEILQKQMQADLGFAKAALASAYGNKPIMFILPELVIFNTDNTTGTITAINSVGVSSQTEMTSLINLFDEYKITSQNYEFMPNQFGKVDTTAVASCLLAMAYDPVDSNVLAGFADATTKQQHKIWGGTVAGTISAPNYQFTRSDSRLYSFHVQIPKGIQLGVLSGAVINAEGEWQRTATYTTNFPYGYVKPYMITAVNTVLPGLSGVMYRHVLFRTRD